MEAIIAQLRDMDFSDADVEAASVHFRAAASTPALENWIDWILSHPQSAPACAAGTTKSVAVVSAPAPPIVAVSEFEFFPCGPSLSVQPHSHVNLTCPGIHVNDVIPPAGGVRPHIPTVARAFRERLRNASTQATFRQELPQLWNMIFRAPPDVSRQSQLFMVHRAAFEFALNELLLACEESRYTESVPFDESTVLAPLEFLKHDSSFLAFVAHEFHLVAPVASVLPRLLRNLLATGDVDWFCALLRMVPSTPSTFFAAGREDHAEISLLYKQMHRLSSIDSALIRLLGDDFSLVGFHVKPVAKKIFLLMNAQLDDDTQKKTSDAAAAESTDTKAAAPTLPPVRIMRVRGPQNHRVRLDPSLSSDQVGALLAGGVFAFSHVSDGWAKLCPIHYKDLQTSDATCIPLTFRPHDPERQGYCVMEWEGRDIFEEPSDAMKETVMSRFTQEKKSQEGHDKYTAAISTDSAIVLSVNLFSLIMVRMMTSQTPYDSCQIEIAEFLLRFIGNAAKSDPFHPPTAALPEKKHIFVTNTCKICTRCSFCTGYGSGCCRCGSTDRSADRGRDCGCGSGKSGCQDCGMCEKCGAQVPCRQSEPKPTVDPVTEKEASARFRYVSQVLASAVISLAQGSDSGSMSAIQLFETSRQRFSQHLQLHMTESRAFLQVLKIFDATQQILLESCDVPEPPDSLICRFGRLTSEQKLAASSDMLATFRFGTGHRLQEAVQGDFTSTLLRGFIALQSPLQPESQKRFDSMLEAVIKVAECAASPQELKNLKWSTRPTVHGCGDDCSLRHNSDGNCLVCGLGWGPHNNHTCTQSPFTGRRGSWMTHSQQVSSPPEVMETTPDSLKITFDPKSGVAVGMQSEVAIESNCDKEVGTIITFNITHGSVSTPKVILGFTRTPPPLTDPVVPKFAIGLDLGQLKIIGSDAKHPVDIGMLQKALSFSHSAAIKVTIVFLGVKALFFVNKVLVYEIAFERLPYFALIASSDPVNIAISSRCEFVGCSDPSREKGKQEKKREKEKEKKVFASSAAAQKVQKLGVPIEQSLSWNLSNTFNEDPLLRQSLKDGARMIAACVNSSAEILLQALILRNHLVNSQLVLVRLALVRRLDAAIASALIDIGIGPLFEHPSFSPVVVDTLLDVWGSNKRQKLLPEVFKLLKKCCSDVMCGKALKMRAFAAFPRLFLAVSHGFGCSSSAALDMIFRHIAPLAIEKPNGGDVIKQVIVPRWVIEHIFPARSVCHILNFAGVKVSALAGAGWADVRVKGDSCVRISLEAAQIYCILLQMSSSEESSPQSPKTPASKALLKDAIYSCDMLPSAVDAALGELQALELLPSYLSNSDSDDAPSVLSTSTLPRSIITSSDGLPALQWLFSKLRSNPVLDEALATHACCAEMSVTPAVFASCLVDMERRGFIERVRGWIAALNTEFDSIKLHSCDAGNATSLLAQHVHVYGDQSAIPSSFERIVVFTPNISADEYGCACSTWTSSFASAASIPTQDMEQDLMNMMKNLSVSNPIVQSHAMDEMMVCHVLQQVGGSTTELARASVYHKGHTLVSPPVVACCGGSDCDYCAPKPGTTPPILPYGHVYQMCPVCLDDKPCVVLPCGHAVCQGDLVEQIATAMRDAETPAAARGGQDARGQSLFALSCSACDFSVQSRLPFSFICAVAPELTSRLRQRLFSALLLSISGGSSPFARCSCGESVFLGVSHECEVLCDSCGFVTTVGDCKRGLSTGSIYPHPGVSSDAAFQWHNLCQAGNADRFGLFRFKACPGCGVISTRCGCPSSGIICDGLERCPNEACDHMSCRNCGTNWCWVCREKGATHSRCPKPLKEVAQTNQRERFKLAASAVSKLESHELPRILTEPFVMHRVRARLLQAYFSSVASEVYLPDLVALPPISLRRRLLLNLMQTLPNVATIYQDSEFLLELVPFASLADVLQQPSKIASKCLQSIQKNLRRDVESIPPSKLLLGAISPQALVDVVTENFPYHSKAARSLLSFKGVGEHANCSITQTLSSIPIEEWPSVLHAAGVEEAESADRILKAAKSFTILPVLYCNAGHKCALVVGAPANGMRCSCCQASINASSTHTLSCHTCAYTHCSRCSVNPSLCTLELRQMHKPPPGCGPDCEEEHFNDGACLVCGRGYGPHNGHNCREGDRGSWIIGGRGRSDDTPGSGGGSDDGGGED